MQAALLKEDLKLEVQRRNSYQWFVEFNTLGVISTLKMIVKILLSASINLAFFLSFYDFHSHFTTFIVYVHVQN